MFRDPPSWPFPVDAQGVQFAANRRPISAGALLVQGSALLALPHSRKAEREADRFSVELMHRAGRDPAAIDRFFELLREKLDDTETNDFLSTHPATRDRIQEAQRYAEEIRRGG